VGVAYLREEEKRNYRGKVKQTTKKKKINEGGRAVDIATADVGGDDRERNKKVVRGTSRDRAPVTES